MKQDSLMHREQTPVIQAFGSLAAVRLGLTVQVQTLGGVARALARDIVEVTRLARAPSGAESAVDQLRRLVDAHEFLLQEARPLAREATAAGDDGSNDLIVGQVIRGNESQSRFVLRHLAPHVAEHGTGSSDGLPQPPLAT